jgi:hypothetical protein
MYMEYIKANIRLIHFLFRRVCNKMICHHCLYKKTWRECNLMGYISCWSMLLMKIVSHDVMYQLENSYNISEEHAVSIFMVWPRSMPGTEKLWRWREYNPPKCWYLLTSQCGVTSLKTCIFINTAVRTSSIVILNDWEEVKIYSRCH